MATLTTPTLLDAADDWEDCYGSAVCSGIVGDLMHRLRGGYHISIEDQPATNFSVVRVDDKAPPGDWPRNRASAIDMSMSLADMKKCHARWRAVWLNRANDPRAKYFNAFNGWDGNGSPGRYNFVTGSVQEASKDHEWHMHLEPKRRYVNSAAMRAAMKSINRGETIAQYLGEDDLVTSQSEFNTLMQGYVNSLLNPAPADDALPDNGVNRRFWRRLAWNQPTNTPNENMYDRISKIFGAVNMTAGQVGSLNQMLTTFIADEVARDAEAAARDAAMIASIRALNDMIGNATGVALTTEQFEALMTSVTNAIAEAGSDAAEQSRRVISQVAEALDNAGTALATANDPLPE